MKKADEIKFNLIRWVRSTGYDILIPNFFVGIYEMDLFHMKQSGLITEYEIKISRSDFFADFNKGNKHQDMVNKCCRANRFYFVVPEGLVNLHEVPEYAGLMVFNGKCFRTLKNAKLIHKNKGSISHETLAQRLSFKLQAYEIKYRKLLRDMKLKKEY